MTGEVVYFVGFMDTNFSWFPVISESIWLVEGHGSYLLDDIFCGSSTT